MKTQSLSRLQLLTIKRCIAVYSFTLFFALNVESQVGSFYPWFGTNGQVITDLGGISGATGTAVQSDGKIVVAGYYATNVNTPIYDFVVIRYNVNGTLDPSFGNGGKVLTDFGLGSSDYANALVIQPNGKILVVGYAYDTHNGFGYALARYDTDGSLDLTFGHRTGKVITRGGQANAVAIDVDGKIVVAGTQGILAGSDFAVLRFNTDGSADNSFGTGGIVLTDFWRPGDDTQFSIDRGTSIALLFGKIYVAGSKYLNFWTYFAIASYNYDGSLNASFGISGTVVTDFGFRTLTFTTPHNGATAISGYIDTTTMTEKLVVGGVTGVDQIYEFDRQTYPQVGEFAIAQYTLDGILDENFGIHGKMITYFGDYFNNGNTSASISALTIYNDNNGELQILAAGTAGGTHFALAQYNEKGLLDAFSVSMLGAANALAIKTGAQPVVYIAGVTVVPGFTAKRLKLRHINCMELLRLAMFRQV